MISSNPCPVCGGEVWFGEFGRVEHPKAYVDCPSYGIVAGLVQLGTAIRRFAKKARKLRLAKAVAHRSYDIVNAAYEPELNRRVQIIDGLLRKIKTAVTELAT